MELKLPKQVLYNSNTRLGKAQPYVLTKSCPNGRFKLLYFHVDPMEIVKLNGGCGDIYGRQEWGPWCLLRVFRYRVVSFKIIHDKEKIKELEEELNS